MRYLWATSRRQAVATARAIRNLTGYLPDVTWAQPYPGRRLRLYQIPIPVTVTEDERVAIGRLIGSGVHWRQVTGDTVERYHRDYYDRYGVRLGLGQ